MEVLLQVFDYQEACRTEKRTVPRLPTHRAAMTDAPCRDCRRTVPRFSGHRAVPFNPTCQVDQLDVPIQSTWRVKSEYLAYILSRHTKVPPYPKNSSLYLFMSNIVHTFARRNVQAQRILVQEGK